MFSRPMVSSVFLQFVSSLGFHGNSYSDQAYLSCTVSLTVRTDGRWRIFSEGDFPNDVWGDWANGAPMSGVGDLAWVRFTRNSTTGTCGDSSPSTGWLQLTSDRVVSVSASVIGTSCARSAQYTVDFSDDGGATTALSGTLTLAASAWDL